MAEAPPPPLQIPAQPIDPPLRRSTWSFVAEATPQAAEAASAEAPAQPPDPAMPPANLARGDTFFARGGRAA